MFIHIRSTKSYLLVSVAIRFIKENGPKLAIALTVSRELNDNLEMATVMVKETFIKFSIDRCNVKLVYIYIYNI